MVFVDTYGQGEGAVDSGGPTREFLTLLMKELLNSRFFFFCGAFVEEEPGTGCHWYVHDGTACISFLTTNVCVCMHLFIYGKSLKVRLKFFFRINFFIRLLCIGFYQSTGTSPLSK